jgi:hypothetical protein
VVGFLHPSITSLRVAVIWALFCICLTLLLLSNVHRQCFAALGFATRGSTKRKTVVQKLRQNYVHVCKVIELVACFTFTGLPVSSILSML